MGGGDPGGTETYPFCSSTSLRPATCQTVPSRSPFSEYKQRAGYTELEPSIMSLPIYHSSSRDLRRFSFYMIHTIGRLLACSTKLHFSSLAPILFILSSPSSLSVFHSPPLRVASFSSSLSRSLGSFFALLESLRRDLNSSLPAPFPDFSSVKSALRRAPVRFSHREAPDNS